MADQRALIFNGKFFEEIEDSEIGDKRIVVYDPDLQMYKEREDEEGFPFIIEEIIKQFLEPNTLIGIGEPKYDGYQIWFNEDIPDYTDPTKNLINQKWNITNYSIV